MVADEEANGALSEIPTEKIFDARTIDCADKHRMIFGRWAETAVGDYFVLLNDHRPTPLKAQFARNYRDAFRWTEIGGRRGLFAVKIERIQDDPRTADDADAGSAAEEALLAWIEIDTRTDEPEAACGRIQRMASAMPEWAGLRARVSAEMPELVVRLHTGGYRVDREREEAGIFYRVGRLSDRRTTSIALPADTQAEHKVQGV